MKESGWNFQRINTMSISFYKSGELNRSSYVKIPLRSNALVNIKNDDKYCFIWSIVAGLHPCNNDHHKRVYKEYFIEMNINGFDFSNGIKCSNMLKFEKLNNLSFNIFELKFIKTKIKRKHKLIPIKISKNESYSVRLINL